MTLVTHLICAGADLRQEEVEFAMQADTGHACCRVRHQQPYAKAMMPTVCYLHQAG